MVMPRCGTHNCMSLHAIHVAQCRGAGAVWCLSAAMRVLYAAPAPCACRSTKRKPANMDAAPSLPCSPRLPSLFLHRLPGCLVDFCKLRNAV